MRAHSRADQRTNGKNRQPVGGRPYADHSSCWSASRGGGGRSLYLSSGLSQSSVLTSPPGGRIVHAPSDRPTRNPRGSSLARGRGRENHAWSSRISRTIKNPRSGPHGTARFIPRVSTRAGARPLPAPPVRVGCRRTSNVASGALVTGAGGGTTGWRTPLFFSWWAVCRACVRAAVGGDERETERTERERLRKER